MQGNICHQTCSDAIVITRRLTIKDYILRSLLQHLKSTRHQEYASNPANFASLDSLIEQGTSFAAFIAGVKRKHEHQQREQQR